MGGTGVKREDVVKELEKEIQPFWQKHEVDEIKATMDWDELLDEIMLHSEMSKIFFAEDKNNFYFIYDDAEDAEKGGQFVIVSFPKEKLSLRGSEEFRFDFF